MLCQECGNRPATMHITKVINNIKKEIHLCAECAEKTGDFELQQPDFTFHHLLKGLLNKDLNLKSSVGLDYKRDERCQECNLDFKNFAENGFLGCSECYKYFDSRLEPILKKIHGHREHAGKVPHREGGNLHLKQEIKDLKRKLKEAVADENYEKAAELRDRIYGLEDKLLE